MARAPLFLIGMPGAGKSTLGVLLAKQLVRSFIDTDILIQQRCGLGLQEYLEQHGFEALRALEERVLLDAHFADSVVATGGSVVYSTAGMARLGSLGPRIYLCVSLATVLQRVTNRDERGLACPTGTSLHDLFEERRPLYERYADHTLELDACNFDQALAGLLSLPAIQRPR